MFKRDEKVFAVSPRSFLSGIAPPLLSGCRLKSHCSHSGQDVRPFSSEREKAQVRLHEYNPLQEHKAAGAEGERHSEQFPESIQYQMGYQGRGKAYTPIKIQIFLAG